MNSPLFYSIPQYFYFYSSPLQTAPQQIPKPPSAPPKRLGRPRGSTKVRGAGLKKNNNPRGRGRGKKEGEEIKNVGQITMEDFPGYGGGATVNDIKLTDLSRFESGKF